ncbi:diacylglycerol O-acyltransferase 1-like isoform X2 [Tigriopus californicus]|uniref:diacylglycerol O-acyltransferase 1-like isoform X2 n=1 Tax=Tigriopus californicus TaxID=6832 RepID=UPI0027DA5541|nr:diacylglycerol O-acyltransferase 1-like isoform X2 [Tigriopus californicus]
MHANLGAGEAHGELRLRRVKSTSRAQEIVTEDEKQRRAQPDKPIHRPKDSLFSWNSTFQDYEGVMNWAFLLLFLGGTRLFLENLNKYGIRVDPSFWLHAIFGNISDGTGEFPTLYLILYTNATVLLCLVFEKLLARDWINWTMGCTLHVINLISLLVVPPVVINLKYKFIGPVTFLLVVIMNSVAFFKLWSFADANRVYRLKYRSDTSRNNQNLAPVPMINQEGGAVMGRRGKEEIVHYPENLGIMDIYYFWLAPTLCYELNFPKMQRVRKLFLMRRVLEVIAGTNIALALIQQWIIPSVVNSLIPFSRLEFGNAAERLLKIAIPNHLIWLTWFYLIFHSFLNTMGEILGFADREFYRDWWNANNILTFWKNWNLPVHRWCVRHIFKPVLKSGYSVQSAQVIVFFISAFFHEYLISVPLRVFKVYAFMGMFLQIPLIFLSSWLERVAGPRAGNICVWLSLIIGQPLAVMMYYHDFVVEHYGRELINYFGQLDA